MKKLKLNFLWKIKFLNKNRILIEKLNFLWKIEFLCSKIEKIFIKFMKNGAFFVFTASSESLSLPRKSRWSCRFLKNLCIGTKTWTQWKFGHRQEWNGTIRSNNTWTGWQEWDDNCACNSFHRPILVAPFLCPVLVRPVIVYVVICITVPTELDSYKDCFYLP